MRQSGDDQEQWAGEKKALLNGELRAGVLERRLRGRKKLDNEDAWKRRSEQREQVQMPASRRMLDVL